MFINEIENVKSGLNQWKYSFGSVSFFCDHHG